MRCFVLHESGDRLRVRVPKLNMSYRQADLLEYYLQNIPGVKKASVDERTGNATIQFADRDADKRSILTEALADYDETSEQVAALVPEETGRALNREYQERLMVQVLTHNAAKLLLPMPLRTLRTVVKSLPYLKKAVQSLGSGTLKVELLDGIAVGTSILRGDIATASSIMFFLDIGETLEDWTRKKSVGDLARAMSLNVDRAWVRKGDQDIQMPLGKIRAGEIIVLRSSDIIPLEGVVVSGEMTVNQSTMTGESVPVPKTEGSYVYAGTVVEEGECLVEVKKESGKGKYDQIVHMIEESEKLKSDAEAKAYRLADSLVPYSFAGFAATYLLTRNLTKALSFLMVDYSCALKLSVPLAVLSAIKEARNYGISIKGGKFMEAVSEADTIVFDKTGTLTYAVPKLVDVVAFGGNDPDEMLRVAACLEEHYPHSMANAIVRGAQEKGLNHEELHSKVEYIVAHGVSSHVGEKKVVIGSYHFVMEDEHCTIPEGEEARLEAIDDRYSRIYLAIDGVLSAVLCIFDPVRKEAVQVIDALRKLGLTTICMMTGDSERTAASVAAQLGLDHYQAEVLPEDKVNYVKEQRAAGHKVIMIGDGINDSPALSEADVGVAIGSGAAITREIADITISADDLMELVVLRRLSRALMQRIHNDYRFIVGFNSMLIGLGVAGVIAPSSSAILHNSSTMVVGVKSMTNLLQETE
ncbi:MAG TPA: heavy metal translocating P-type ATPase [Oribacterium sp.]|nr:heavy metal translocating P-type ATPase [Oribacterium sp.]